MTCIPDSSTTSCGREKGKDKDRQETVNTYTVYMTQKITQSSRAEKSEALARATMGTMQPLIETLPGTEQGAKGLDTQAAVELQLGRRSLLLSGSRLE